MTLNPTNGGTRDFWLSSGFALLDRTPEGRLAPTPAYMAAYWRRPEVAPVAESNAAERSLHAGLLADPLRPVSDAELATLADPDAIDNYRAVLRFRDFLFAHPTLEAGYLKVATEGGIAFPPQFVDHLAHAILRAALDGTADPFRVRAGELFFRSQRVTLGDERVMVADLEIVDAQARARAEAVGRRPVGLALPGVDPNMVEVEVLAEETRDEYWHRSDAFDTAIDIAYPQPGLDGLARALEAWVRHLTGVESRVTPMRRIDDEKWVWHVGLDREANAILNALYQGETLDDDRLRRILALFRMEIADRSAVLDRVAGRPVYLGLAMDPDGAVRMKPQNLVANLPLRPRS